MFFVTFHGGHGGVASLYTYNDDGSGGTAYFTPPGSGEQGLRDVQFLPAASGGQVYLVNSYKNSSQIWQFSPGSQPASPVVSGPGGSGATICSVYHPFAMAFDGLMNVCYVSNQDTNVVVRLYGPGSSANAWQPMPVNPSLPSSSASYLPGTFAASQVALSGPACTVPPTVSSKDGGLSTKPSKLQPADTPNNSVRGVALIGNTLYVADEPDNAIRMYDTVQGTYLGKLNDPDSLIQSPTHLLVQNCLLFVTVASSVLCFDPSQQKLTAVISGLTAPSGITFDGSGNFYVCERTNLTVLQYNSAFQQASTSPFIPQAGNTMPDQPEFILWLNNVWLG
jgi:hypothetical protein